MHGSHGLPGTQAGPGGLSWGPPCSTDFPVDLPTDLPSSSEPQAHE
ncbi:hypothetical protein RR42_s1741 [Cupriavidus basilensis]|uniref:Uncharacterized protein n=1 Tax=Cupriavidus basilensis TaxID=68895 RepID=A0A0C4YMP3_9BURK|nr:hypothetical protein RR42_s1741 [Cupriavidus basilensis]